MSTLNLNNEISLWDLMHIGSNLEFLCRVTSRTRIKSSHPDQMDINDRLVMLKQDLARLELPQSEQILQEEVEELLQRLEANGRLNSLGKEAKPLRRLARKVKQSLSEEGSRRSAFTALRDRSGYIEELLRDPVQFFGIQPGGVLELTPICVEDFYEAARCYSVGFSSASIMFMLRATEEILKGYYSKVTRQDASRGNWGNLLTVLRIPVLKCPRDLLALLEELLRKRNAAMHPNRREPHEWNIDAARDILEKCRQAIQMMVADLQTR